MPGEGWEEEGGKRSLPHHFYIMKKGRGEGEEDLFSVPFTSSARLQRRRGGKGGKEGLISLWHASYPYREKKKKGREGEAGECHVHQPEGLLKSSTVGKEKKGTDRESGPPKYILPRKRERKEKTVGVMMYEMLTGQPPCPKGRQKKCRANRVFPRSEKKEEKKRWRSKTKRFQTIVYFIAARERGGEEERDAPFQFLAGRE